jgi:hypothetical protein
MWIDRFGNMGNFCRNNFLSTGINALTIFFSRMLDYGRL